MAKNDAGQKKRDEFFSGVLILSLSAVIVKIIGLLYKIPMLRLLGSEGMGYFNSAYEVYVLFCSVATTGLPVAMAVMISSQKGNESESKRIFRVSLRLFLILGGVGSIIMLAFAKGFASFLGSEMALPCMLAISPAVLLICVSGAYRGYFQGKGRMVPTALSQTIEALGKLILGLAFALLALNVGAETHIVAAMAVVGLTLGTAVSSLFLAVTKRLGDRKDLLPITSANSGECILPTLLKTAVPVTLSSCIVSLTKVVDMSTILRRLQALGESSEEAFALYGSYTTLALPLFSLAPALVTSVAMPLIPSLSGAVAKGDGEEQSRVVKDALRLTVLISAPASVGLTLFSSPILHLIFSGESVAIATAAPLLSILGLSVTLSCLITVGNAVLQAYGKAHVPMISIAVGSLIKIAVTYLLMGVPDIGLLGAPIGTLCCDLVINIINFYFIGKVTFGISIVSDVLLRPYLSALVAVCLSRVAYNILCSRFGESALITIALIMFAASLYFVIALISGAIKTEDALAFLKKSRLNKEKYTQ